MYTLQSGAEKKRLRQAEQAEWESRNGPVIVIKIGELFEDNQA